MSKLFRRPALLGLFSMFAVLGAYASFVRPWHLRWGATRDEAEAWLPGDDLTPSPKLQATHAVTIRAPVREVWAWLVQIGQGRGGFYSYSMIETLLGLDMRTAQRIRPDLQNLHAADAIPLTPDGSAALPVDIIQPGRTLVLHTEKPLPNRLSVMQASVYSNLTWSFHLRALDDETTRLVERLRADWDRDWRKTVLIRAVLEPGAFLMQRRMLLGIKERAERSWAERQSNQTHPTLLDTVLPDYEFRDSVSEEIEASPSAIFQAIREATRVEKPLANMLAELRELPARVIGAANGSSTTHEKDPFINFVLNGANGMTVLAEERSREIVLGAAGKLHDLIEPHVVPIQSLKEFLAFSRPNCEKLAISLRIEPTGHPARQRLVLEHRTHALDAEAGRKFAAYWLGARPIGTLAARELLAVIKRRAEIIASEPC
ncbi:MAG: hypothetical protein RMM31_08075 [Anaerolineae bacterium]|nr:hypothetical protein [Anaerolineae bacterium]